MTSDEDKMVAYMRIADLPPSRMRWVHSIYGKKYLFYRPSSRVKGVEPFHLYFNIEAEKDSLVFTFWYKIREDGLYLHTTGLPFIKLIDWRDYI